MSGVKIRAEAISTIRFRYVNWRGDEHEYVIDVESIEYGRYDAGGYGQGQRLQWVLNGFVVTRDGEERRDEKGNQMRRTFMLDGITDPEMREGVRWTSFS